MSERPQYGDRIEVRDGDVWVKAKHDGEYEHHPNSQFSAFSARGFFHLRYDGEGTTWRRAE